VFLSVFIRPTPQTPSSLPITDFVDSGTIILREKDDTLLVPNAFIL